MKHEILLFSIYVYICFKKRYKDFKGSQIAMNEFLWEGRHQELASIRTQALPAGIKLAYKILTYRLRTLALSRI